MALPYTQKYFVGIDLGTGSTKAVAISDSGQPIFTAQHHYATSNPQPGYSEQNPDLIWQAFLKCINEITEKAGSAPVAIGFSSAMHSILPVNQNGEALADAILWADSRSGDIAKAIRESEDGEEIYKHTGTAIYAMSPLCKLIWLRQNQPQLFNNAFKFISLKEYIWAKLFGVFEVDHSTASATGLFDIVDCNWFLQSLSLAGIEHVKLSQPVATSHIRYLAEENILLSGVTTETAFVIGASDGCCANLGGNAVRPGVAALTIGTSGAVRVGSDKPIFNYSAMTFNYLLDQHTFICGGAVNNGGAAVDWLLKNFLKIHTINAETYRQVFDDIDIVPAGSNGLVFLPYLFAERAPIWDAKSSGAFLNINFNHKQPHFLRAALEGICFALYDVLNAVESSSEPVEEIVISGGFISSPVWVQVLADITGKRLVLLQAEDSSAVGAVYLAMQAIGIEIKEIVEKEYDARVVVKPNMHNNGIYSAIFPVYKKLYNDLKESMHLMHDLNL